MLLKQALAAVALTSMSVSAFAATYDYSGTISSCTGICSIFTTVGQTADISFDAPDGPGSIAIGDVSNVDIALSTPSGGALAFVGGTALDSSLTTDSLNNVTGGTITLQATGSTTGIVARSIIDADAGTWEAFVVGTDGSLTPVAAGTGSFAVTAVPVPASVWMMGSALLGLGVSARRRKA